ncbi:diguanylate cyclase domain-containing protein [Streptomyces sp. NPDC057580]|uniref:diguanylate cyclase domain-containing protein n=1 Tax=Streptomyces sp. NPDC057580 TaxID=3346173 RepID=UPI0036929B79
MADHRQRCSGVRENYFKDINDSLGHAAGDTVRASIAARLTAWAGPHAAIDRLGGDEPLTELTRSFSQVRRPFF